MQVHTGKAGSRKASMSSLVIIDTDFRGLVYSKFGCLKAPCLEHDGQGTTAESILLTRN